MSSGTYQHITYLGMRNLIATNLGDPGKVFWTDAELAVYVKEALRTWGLASGYWRDRGVFTSTSGVAFYDLQSKLSTLLGANVTDRELIATMQYQLLESASSQTTWTGTDMFTLQGLANNLQNARNRFQVETGQIMTIYQGGSRLSMPSPNFNRVPLDDHIIDVRRAVWFNAAGVVSFLDRVDEWSLSSLIGRWTDTPQTPYAHSILTTKPLTLLVAPPPNVPGALGLITTNSIDSFNPASTASLLSVYDNSAPVIKWGALADALGGDGQPSDTTRYQTAIQRWKEGLQLVQIAPVIFYAEINGEPVQPQSVFSFDRLTTNWETTSSSAPPTFLGTIGQNVIALNPLPNGVYSVTLDVARNAPLPTLDGDFIQVGREEIDPIASYAQHLALFKVGGNELVDSEKWVKDFYGAASLYNQRLKANALFASTVFNISTSDEARRPRQLRVAQPPQGQGQ